MPGEAKPASGRGTDHAQFLTGSNHPCLSNHVVPDGHADRRRL